MYFSLENIQQLKSRYRGHFINGITGYKCLHLLVTSNQKGINNLAVISSVVHLGADPALIGFIMRPATIRRDSLDNILLKKKFTLNSVNDQHWQQAHHTSAKFEPDISEFDQCGFEVESLELFDAPFVKSSDIKMGFELESTTTLVNDTVFVIGKLVHLMVKDEMIKEDGFVDLQAGNICVSSGLDSYHKPNLLGRLSYASASQKPFELKL